MSGKGAFITVEGEEGVGKSTHVKYLARKLKETGFDIVVTREPGGTPLAESIRELVLNSDVDPLTELLLMFAARASHVNQVILPALAAGQWVVCDRFIDATWAYQGGGRGMSEEAIRSLEQLVLGDLRPDLTLLLVTNPKVAAYRRGKRTVSDRFEQEDEAFFQRVRQAYERRAQAEPERFAIVDTGGALEVSHRALDETLDLFVENY